MQKIIDLTQLARHTLETQPYTWAEISNLFSPQDAEALTDSFPLDHFKTVVGYDGEKDYQYEARSLLDMGADRISYPEELSEPWLRLAQDLLSPAYRAAMSSLTAYDLTAVPVEVNVFHYGPGSSLGPHLDLQDKLVTHVLYFNRAWNHQDGGCLSVLRSADPADLAAEVAPLVGNSAVLVRSEKSWHAVSRVVNDCRESRRSMTVTFYRPGSISTMWPPGDATPLHRHNANALQINTRSSPGWWSRWRRRFGTQKP
jgi:SM-20-related protein